jgi:hypothetical protein
MSIENTIGLQVYIIDLIGSVQEVIGIISILAGIASIIIAGCLLSADEWSDSPSGQKFVKKTAWCSLILLIFATILPSQKALYLIMSDGIVLEVNQRRIPEKALEILDRKLDEYLKKNK